MKRLIVLAAALGLLFAWGCSSETEETAGAVITQEQDATDDATPEQDVKSAEAQVVNDPAQVQQGGAYRIEPADPNDPKYKPDPRLGGGG